MIDSRTRHDMLNEIHRERGACNGKENFDRHGSRHALDVTLF